MALFQTLLHLHWLMATPAGQTPQSQPSLARQTHPWCSSSASSAWPRCRCLDSSSSRKDGRSEVRGRGRQETGVRPPGTRPTHLIERHNEGTLFLLEQVDRLERLGLQTVHDVHHQDGDVAQRAASVPQVTEWKHNNRSGKAA